MPLSEAMPGITCGAPTPGITEPAVRTATRQPPTYAMTETHRTLAKETSSIRGTRFSPHTSRKSAMMTPPMGGTYCPSVESHGMRRLSTPASARTMPIRPPARMNGRLRSKSNASLPATPKA